jgi:type I restriction enzyme M protein
MEAIGQEEHRDFNAFQKMVDKALKELPYGKLSASEKKAIFNAITWYDEEAEKVVKKTQKLKDDKLQDLLQHLGCTEAELPDYGYYPTGKPGQYTIYETESSLRDYENVPLKEDIHDYFRREVKPHVPEAWIELDKTKIGYEISFNKYFYQHTPLRSLEEVSAEILELEKENEGLIMEILNLA